LQQDSFDVVLMDWQLPEMDGIEVTRLVRSGAAGETARQVPIVALTANAFAEDRQACLDAGMNDFLTKPVLAAGLMATVERWARKRSGAAGAAPLAPEPAAPAGPPVFDRSLLAALPMVADGTQPDYADEVLDLYMNSLPGTLTSMRKALAQDDRKTLQRNAHTLKSASASVGAMAVAELAARTEQSLRSGETPAPDLADRLQAEIERLAAAMDAMRPLRFAGEGIG
jgi:CheY-like chemotaxis protein